FVSEENKKPLADEFDLVQTLFREQIASGVATLDAVPSASAAAKRCALHGRRRLCHCLTIGMHHHDLVAADTQVRQLSLANREPELHAAADAEGFDADEPFEYWTRMLTQLFALWI